MYNCECCIGNFDGICSAEDCYCGSHFVCKNGDDCSVCEFYSEIFGCVFQGGE